MSEHKCCFYCSLSSSSGSVYSHWIFNKEFDYLDNLNVQLAGIEVETLVVRTHIARYLQLTIENSAFEKKFLHPTLSKRDFFFSTTERKPFRWGEMYIIFKLLTQKQLKDTHCCVCKTMHQWFFSSSSLCCLPFMAKLSSCWVLVKHVNSVHLKYWHLKTCYQSVINITPWLSRCQG